MRRVPNTVYDPAPVAHGRRRRTKGVVIHTIEGSDESAEHWFRDRRARGVGAHLLVGQTQVQQLTDLDNICWHCAGQNATTIGIEHEGYARYTKSRWLRKENRALLRRSANRTAWICWKYKLGRPRRGKNVWGHADFPAGGHTDPGKGWPWVFYMMLARQAYKNLTRTGKW